jgi:hypothetical protein
MTYDTASSHRIRRVVFDIDYPDEMTALVKRARFEELFYHEILPSLDGEFSKFSSNGDVYRINRMEIDLGVCDPERFDSALILHSIRRQLNKYLRNAIESKAVSRPPEVSLERLLSRFLERGELPWYSSHVGPDSIERALLALPKAAAVQLSRHLVPILQHQKHRLRFIYQFSLDLYLWLMQSLHPKRWGLFTSAATSMFESLDSIKAREAVLFVAIQTPPDQPVKVAVLRQRIKECAGLFFRFSTDEDSDSGEDSRVESGDEITLVGTGENGQSVDLPDQGETEIEDEGAIYVKNAGIVLLHPFLVRFFGALKLLDNDQQFVSDESRERGIHLLHFVATGREEPAENETTLLKVLCGWSTHIPIIRRLSLSAAEKYETDNLLTTAIQHWNKIGNTSPDGLRESFFQRDGKLTQGDSGWNIAVERKTIDILLDYLPWQLSVIRLPWQKSSIHVDWV